MAQELASGDYVTASVRLVRPLAQGGMGTVWLADHLTLGMQVVVKLMSKDVAAASDAASRFAREAAVAAAVKSPHVVQVFDSGVTEGGVAFIVMELLEGRDLGAHIQARGRLTPTEVGPILAQLGKALGKAHRVGVVHRDIKPENVYLCDVEGDEPFVKLLDFGTAKDDKRAPFATGIGQLIGTPYYMSPEQILGEAVDHRTDIWSLGVVVYEALTGKRPFDGATVGAVTLAIHTTEPRPSQEVPELPATLDDWFARACARAPADRFQNVRGATHAFVRAALGEPLGPESSPSSFEDLSGIPPSSISSTVNIVVPPPPTDSSAPLARTTTTLSSTLASPRGQERRTMLLLAGVVAAAALAAMIALVTSDGGGRTNAGGEPPSVTSATGAVAPSGAPATGAPFASVAVGGPPAGGLPAGGPAATPGALATGTGTVGAAATGASTTALPAPPAPAVPRAISTGPTTPRLPSPPTARSVPPLPVFPIPNASGSASPTATATGAPSATPSVTATATPTDPATDKPATDKPATDKPASDKPASDKPASDKSSADFPPEPLPTMQPSPSPAAPSPE